MRQLVTLFGLMMVCSTVACSDHSARRADEFTHFETQGTARRALRREGVVIRGSLVNAKGGPGPALTLSPIEGLAPSRKTIALSTNLTTEDFNELVAIKGLRTFVTYGCSRYHHEITGGRLFARFAEGASLDARAEVVILCDDVKFDSPNVTIAANQVFMINARVDAGDKFEARLKIITNELHLRGSNLITAKTNFTNARLTTPKLTVIANRVMELGALEVETDAVMPLSATPQK